MSYHQSLDLNDVNAMTQKYQKNLVPNPKTPALKQKRQWHSVYDIDSGDTLHIV